jgi:manganese-dependent inorganic pyrophosphatase
MSKTYVIGHINPDTDTIAAATGYAWLLNERDDSAVQAARAGTLNMQTAWVLKHLELDAPILLNDASPRFETLVRRLDTTDPDAPLREAWAIASRTGGVAPVVDADGKPFGLITGGSIFAFMSQTVGTHSNRQEMKIADVLDAPCREACNMDVPKLKAKGRIRDSLNRLLRYEGDNFFVVNESGVYRGVCRQREALNPPRIKIIMVDHNEARQALAHLEEAELIEILDHHRLGNPSTHVPIRFTVDIVGSTSTLVSEKIEEAGLSAPPRIAGLLLAGLLSDTLILTSPTTTDRDKAAAKRMGRWAFVHGGPLESETVQSYGEQILSAGAGLSSRTPEEIVSTDMKLYDGGNYRFAVAQAEVTDLQQLAKYLEKLKVALEDLRSKKAVDFAMLMVTDVVRGSSQLLIVNEPPELNDLPYPRQPDGTRRAKGVVSRKKQLLPGVLGLLER